MAQMNGWLGVVSRSHVQHGVQLGIAQFNHGKRAAVARPHAGDVVVYYSPRTDYPDGEPLKAFTAIGTVVDDEVWQADEGDFKPWRRRVEYRESVEVPIADLAGRLEFTSSPNWGYLLRRGLLPLAPGDVAVIESAMCGPADGGERQPEL